MKTWKTPKGTELRIMDMRGKDYMEVSQRLIWFREECPSWSIRTEFVELNLKDRYAIAKASVYASDAALNYDILVATAHKMENAAGFADYLEKAETGAIGRALAMCGYGTQFAASDLEEGPRIVDAPQPPLSPTPPRKKPDPQGSTELSVTAGRITEKDGKQFQKLRLDDGNEIWNNTQPFVPARSGVLRVILDARGGVSQIL